MNTTPYLDRHAHATNVCTLRRLLWHASFVCAVSGIVEMTNWGFSQLAADVYIQRLAEPAGFIQRDRDNGGGAEPNLRSQPYFPTNSQNDASIPRNTPQAAAIRRAIMVLRNLSD